MNWIKSSLFLILTFSFSSLLSSESFEGKKVNKLEIILEDNESADNKAVRSKLKTQEGVLFSQLDFDEDLKNLSKDYDRIDPAFEIKDDSLNISLKLWAKPWIKKITWVGNTHIKTSTLKHELDIEDNTQFNLDSFTKGIHKVKDYYHKKGYYEAQITYTTKPMQTEKNHVFVTINIVEGKEGHIKNIEFHGVTKEEEKSLLEQMYTKKYNVLMSWLTGEGFYNADAQEQDKIALLNYLHNHGYADATASIRSIEDSKTSRIIFDITINKGVIYHFGKITFSGNKIFPNEKIQKAIQIKSGDVFSPEKVRDTAQAIKDAYGKKGYIEADVNYDPYLREKETIYDVNFTLDEGECFRIGMIRIFGNSQTNSNVILRESLLIPGEVFDSRKLKATQERLENIGYFKNVNVYSVKSIDTFSLGPNYRDVHIEVEEGSTGTASLSGGMSSDKTIIGVVDISERNFNYRGLGHMFSQGISVLRGGGEYAHLKASFGKWEQTVVFTWMTPYLYDSKWRFGFEPSYSRSQIESKDYKTQTYGGSVFVSYPLTDFWTYGNKYRLRHSHTRIDKDVGPEAQQVAREEGLISGLGGYVAYDSTDNARKAHRGWRNAFETEYVGLGGINHFVKLGQVNTFYYPLWPKATLKARAEFRFIEPLMHKNKLVLSERFFLGGDMDVRGYKPHILGPRFDDHKEDPKGGISSTLLSLEISQEIHRLADIFIFIDAGSISMERLNINHHNINGSYGIGVRLDLMQRLPLMGGVCLPIHPRYKSDFNYYFFSMMGIF